MKLLLSADQHWGIGKNNRLLFRADGDLQFFYRMTRHKVVIMGRRTRESLPHAAPLSGCVNMVLSRNADRHVTGATVCGSLPALFCALRPYRGTDIFVVGGEQVCRQLLPYCSTAYITRWHAWADADRFLPNLDDLPDWKQVAQSPPQTEGALTYQFCTYVHDYPRLWDDFTNTAEKLLT